jgi:hypothetical protein
MTTTTDLVGEVRVRLFEDGGVELAFDVDDDHRAALLAAATSRLQATHDRLRRDEPFPISCATCGAPVRGVTAGTSSESTLAPCRHRADWR